MGEADHLVSTACTCMALGSYSYTSVCCTAIHYWNAGDTVLFSKATLYALSQKARNVVKGWTADGNTARLYWSSILSLGTCKLHFYTLHIAIVYFIEYFSMLLSASSAYVCLWIIHGTAHTHTKSGYQTLLSFFQVPGLVLLMNILTRTMNTLSELWLLSMN